MHGKGMRWSGLSPEDHPREKQLSLAASLSPNRDRVKSIKRNSMTIRIRSLQLCRAFPGYLDGTRKKREHRTAHLVLLIEHLCRRTAVSYTHLRAHETDSYLVCRLLL